MGGSLQQEGRRLGHQVRQTQGQLHHYWQSLAEEAGTLLFFKLLVKVSIKCQVQSVVYRSHVAIKIGNIYRQTEEGSKKETAGIVTSGDD